MTNTNFEYLLEAIEKKGWTAQIIEGVTDRMAIVTTSDKTSFVITGALTPLSNASIRVLAVDKLAANKFAKSIGVNVPDFEQATEEAISRFIEEYGKIVIKPAKGSRGRHVYFVSSIGEAKIFLSEAKDEFDDFIVQKMATGVEARFYILDYECVGVTQRIPPSVIGDGVKTVEALIEAENILREDKGVLTIIDVAEVVRFGEQALLDYVPVAGEQVVLMSTVNMSKGATSINITKSVHEGYKQISEKFARILKSKFIAVDIMIDNIESVPDSENYSFIEINDSPGFRSLYTADNADDYDIAADIINKIEENL
jgi:cyanophycin synthetase